MALLPCRECGNEVSTSAPVCPKCGAPAPVGKTSHVSVVRGKRLTGGLVMLQVAVDDDQNGWVDLGGNRTLELDLVPGNHELFVGWGGDGGYFKYDFETEHGQTVNATVTFAKGVTFD